MKFFMHTKIGLFIASLIAVLIFGATFTGCEPKPIPTSENRVKVEDNFHHEKIWTEDDFKQAQADIDPLDIVYGGCDKLTGDCPPMITVDDVKLINATTKPEWKN